LALQFWIGGIGFKTTGTYQWTNTSNQLVTEKMFIEIRHIIAGTEVLFAFDRKAKVIVEPGIGTNVNFSTNVKNYNTTDELNIYGGLVVRDQFRLSELTTSLMFYGFVQISVFKNHSLRIMYWPNRALDNLGNSKPKEEIIAASYHFAFRKR
jgi:hypothetical protein